MKVARITGFDWTYRVDQFEVDLAAYAGNGSCTCDAFMEVARIVLEGGARASDSTRCDHILSAWKHVRDHEFERLAVPYMSRLFHQLQTRKQIGI